MAFERRQQADYGELTQPDEAVANRVMEEAETFFQGVQTHLTTRGFLSPK
jgi:uncharacterized protein (UPF0332 family)